MDISTMNIMMLLLSLGLACAVHPFRSLLSQLLHVFMRVTRNRSRKKPADHASGPTTKELIDNIKRHAHRHETAAVLHELIRTDGAGSWPPRTNYDLTAWPTALRPYKQIYLELAPLLPQRELAACLDDQVNRRRITTFRARFATLLRERIDLVQVRRLLLEAADTDADVDTGHWELDDAVPSDSDSDSGSGSGSSFPRAVYNALYCCIASSRHAYRWGMIPVVRVAQREDEVQLPEELVVPWQALQQHFGCRSDSGNNTSNMVLNFEEEEDEDDDENDDHSAVKDLDHHRPKAPKTPVFIANTGMPAHIIAAEAAFVHIFRETERQALPVYHDMALASLSWARDDKAACAGYVARMDARLRDVLGTYFHTMHNGRIPRAAWLSRVQGFFAWGVGFRDERSASGAWVKFDGLSGNQVLLFQALDAFLGLEPYLSERDQERNVPARQRKLREAFEKHSFRRHLSSSDEDDQRILQEMDHLIKRLRVSDLYL